LPEKHLLQEERVNVLLVGNESSAIAPYAKRMEEEYQIYPFHVDSGNAGLSLLLENAGNKLDLVIVDELLFDMTGIEFIRRVVRLNPWVNTVIVGSMPDKDFHEATEGLGVLLQLSPNPEMQDVKALFELCMKLRRLIPTEDSGARNK
jgi:response regulator RpfG family c-di-GMP phosphodiesterase